VLRLAQRHGIELPISELVGDVLHARITPTEGLQRLLAREQKPEYPEGLFG
jgi:glycerol-3-phosphate dehydrogenase (NAD(P)+)